MFVNCEDCSWFFQKNSKRCYHSSWNVSCEDSKFLLDSYSTKDCYDDCFAGIESSEKNLETLGNQDAKACISLSWCFNGPYKIFYSDSCHACSNCFGCVWLRSKSYCILNKEYSKEEYEALVSRIIEHMLKTWEWWEFFPSSLSPFWYNETVAQELFPFSREDIIFAEKGINEKVAFLHWPIFNWSDYESPFPKVEKIISASKLPENIIDIPNDILNWAIECEISKKPFRITEQELSFYRKHNLPIPKKHPDQRHFERLELRKSITIL
jgi:hypothetical protein